MPDDQRTPKPPRDDLTRTRHDLPSAADLEASRPPRPTEQTMAIARATSKELAVELKPELDASTAATGQLVHRVNNLEGAVSSVRIEVGELRVDIGKLDERTEGQRQLVEVVHDNVQKIADVTLHRIKARTESEEHERRVRTSNAAHRSWWLREVSLKLIAALTSTAVIGAVIGALATRGC
ncbi:MAG: hypothetical protein QOI20_3292 [Acidimicrobiaceae bacterium]|nr:hypothetical protein [Acidimicrobiaceae bacterium]